MPSNQLELALWLESDRMGYLLETVDQAKLSNQQDVVRNERRQSTREPAVRHRRGSDVPGAVSERASVPRRRHRIARRHPGREARRRERVFPAVLRAEQRDDCDRRRHRQGGDQEAHREVLRHAEARARCSARERARRPSSPRSAGSWSKIASSCRGSTWRGSRRAFFKEGDADADIAGSILGQGRVSRLYKKLEYEKQIAQNVNAYQYSTMLGSVFGIEATARPGRTLQELEAVINEELELLRDQGTDRGGSGSRAQRARNADLQRAAARRRIRRRGRSAEPLQPLRRNARLPGRRTSCAAAA